LKQTPNHRAVEPPGMERTILRLLPQAALASVVIPGLFYAYVRYVQPANPEKTIIAAAIAAIAVVVTLCTAIFTIAIACWIVVVMKGPPKYADSYPLQDADQPGEDI